MTAVLAYLGFVIVGACACGWYAQSLGMEP